MVFDGREICCNWHQNVCSECGIVAHPEFPASRLSEPNQRMGVIAAGTLVSFLLIVLLSLLCCCCLCRHKDDHKWVTDECLLRQEKNLKFLKFLKFQAHPGHENKYFLFTLSQRYRVVKGITSDELSFKCFNTLILTRAYEENCEQPLKRHKARLNMLLLNDSFGFPWCHPFSVLTKTTLPTAKKLSGSCVDDSAESALNFPVFHWGDRNCPK